MFKSVFIIIFCAFLCVACQKKENQENTLRMGTNPAYPPYESIDANGQCVGFDVDVGHAIAQKLSKQLVVKEFSFDALILALKQKKIDIVLSGMSITPSRLKEMAMIPYQGEPVKSLCLAFWKKEPLSIGGLDTLGVIAVQVGTYQETYLQQLKNVKIKPLEGNVEIIMDLQHGKSQAAVFEPHIAKAMQERFSELKCVAIPLSEENWVLGNGIGIRKDNTQLIDEVTKAVQELKEEGTIQKLEQKWFQGNAS